MTDAKKKSPTSRAPRKRAKAAPKSAASKSKAAATTPDLQADTSAPRASMLATIPIPIRWRDLDALNHVNNASYMTYLEEARLQWLRGVPGEWFGEHAVPVMAAVELHYRKPITWPAEVAVQLTCERLGNSSLTIGNRIVDRHDSTCIYSDGQTVIVWVNPVSDTSVPLPQAIRQACSA